MVTLSKVAETVREDQEARGQRFESSPDRILRLSLAEALKAPKLLGLSGIYALYPASGDRILMLGCAEDVGAELQRHALGHTSAALELLASRAADSLTVEVLPLPEEAIRRVYVAARALLEDEYRVSLPLNRDRLETR